MTSHQTKLKTVEHVGEGVVGALGTVPKCLENIVEEVEIK